MDGMERTLASVVADIDNLQKVRSVSKISADAALDLLMLIDTSSYWEIFPIYPRVYEFPAYKDLLGMDWQYNPSVYIQIKAGRITTCGVSKFSPAGKIDFRQQWDDPELKFVVDLIPRVLSLQETDVLLD